MKKLLGVVLILTAGVADVANAGIPLFNFTCPGSIEVHADEGGPVFINGKQAQLKKFNNNSYEAKGSDVTISITINPDGTPSVSYTGLGRANGVCQNKDRSQGQGDQGSSSSSNQGKTPENLYSSVPPALKDLVGAKAGQAEGELNRRGYTYRNTQTWDGGKTAYYVENRTGYCVEVGTIEGRYSSIVYNSSDRCQ